MRLLSSMKYETNIESRKRELRWMIEELMERRKTPMPTAEFTEAFALESLSVKELNKLNWWIRSRGREKPLQYCLGWQTFLDLRIALRPPVLIPRWETEEWTDRLIKKLQNSQSRPKRILELCAGSGCISLALAKAFPDAQVTGLDISTASNRLSRVNQRRNGVSNLRFQLVDLFSPRIKEFAQFDLVVSNPPYVSQKEYAVLDPSVKDWEDPRALLTTDDDGVEFYEHISKSKHLLADNALLVFEIGETQGRLVSSIMAKNDFCNIIVEKDSAGSDRTVSGNIG